MIRILAIDFGRKRVGLAVSDPGQIIANRLATVPASVIWDFLSDYFMKEEVNEIVIGYPRQLNNQPSEAVLYINPFIKKFRQKYPEMRIELIDERENNRSITYKYDGGIVEFVKYLNKNRDVLYNKPFYICGKKDDI